MKGKKIIKFYEKLIISHHAINRLKEALGITRTMTKDEVKSIFENSERISKDEMYRIGFRPGQWRKQFTWYFKGEIQNTIFVFIISESSIIEKALVINTTYSESRQSKIFNIES